MSHIITICFFGRNMHIFYAHCHLHRVLDDDCFKMISIGYRPFFVEQIFKMCFLVIWKSFYLRSIHPHQNNTFGYGIFRDILSSFFSNCIWTHFIVYLYCVVVYFVFLLVRIAFRISYLYVLIMFSLLFFFSFIFMYFMLMLPLLLLSVSCQQTKTIFNPSI